MNTWKPAQEAPLDVDLLTRFERDGEIIERPMTRLRAGLWWDIPFHQYAHENPIEYTELEPA